MPAPRTQEAGFQLAEPLVLTDRLLFARRHQVEVALGLPGVAIHTTLDGTDPTSSDPRVEGPIALTETATLRARAFHPDWAPSDVVTREFVRVRGAPRGVDLVTPPADAYPGRGAETLRDLRGGGTDFGDGSWLGYREDDLLAVLDLGRPSPLGEIVVSTLAINSSWIFLPGAIEVETSSDGRTFERAATREYPSPKRPESDGHRFLRLSLATGRGAAPTARYLRVLVRRRGPMPEWHAAPGAPAWLFVDAIAVVG